jgi:hypothetical protein
MLDVRGSFSHHCVAFDPLVLGSSQELQELIDLSEAGTFLITWLLILICLCDVFLRS